MGKRGGVEMMVWSCASRVMEDRVGGIRPKIMSVIIFAYPMCFGRLVESQKDLTM